MGLAALLLSQTACTTSSEYVRGARLRQVPLDETHTDTLETTLDSSYVARVLVKRNTCTEVSTEYAKKRIDTKKSPPMDSVLIGLGLLGGGLFLMSQAEESDDEDESLDLGWTLGLGLAIGSIYPLITALTDEDVRRVEVNTGEVVEERSKNCNDRTFALEAPLQWTVTMGSARRTGRTGDGGTVSLPRPLYELVEESITNEAGVRRLVAGRGIGFRLDFERAPAKDFRLDSKALPDAFFQRFVAQYRRQLSGDASARFENCELIGKSSRETLECYWSQ